jgi:hypothetical protein
LQEHGITSNIQNFVFYPKWNKAILFQPSSRPTTAGMPATERMPAATGTKATPARSNRKDDSISMPAQHNRVQATAEMIATTGRQQKQRCLQK